MNSRLKIITRVFLFCVIFVLMFFALNVFFQPVWLGNNNYYTINGFYKEPDNTIQTLFLGASVTARGFTPMQLYEDHGICAYNLGTTEQPMLASYYWLKEVYRLHSKTLKSVVLEVSELRDKGHGAAYHKALDRMKFSSVKYNAVKDYAKGDLSKMAEFLMPLIPYHSRWDELENDDIDKYSWNAINGIRGYTFQEKMRKYTQPKNPTVLDTLAKPKKLVDASVGWFEKTVQFCKDNGIKLILTKTVAVNWNSNLHNSVQALADKHGLAFIDFNFAPVYDDINFTVFDFADATHHNWYGSVKATKYIGDYLAENSLVTDIRNDKHWLHMQQQYELYKSRVLDKVVLSDTTDIASYLKTAIKKDTAVFISVNDEGSETLTDEQRKEFASLGLTKLSELKFRQSYLAVVQNGKVVLEQIKPADSADKTPLKHSGKLEGCTKYTVQSGGYEHGKVSSCLIDGSETMDSLRGINITVYNEGVGEVIDKTNFDIYVSSTRDVYTLDSVNVLNDIQSAEPDSYKSKIIEYDAALKALNTEQK